MDFSKKISLCLCTFFLTACGGGGSSEKGPSTPPVISSPDYSKVGVEINNDSASVIVPYTMAMVESTLQIVDLFVSELKIQQISAETPTVSLPCEHDGTTDFVWQDMDNSMGLSVSDTLELTFENCQSSSLNGAIAGNSSLTVEIKSSDSIGFSVQLNATISESGQDIPVSGAMSFVYNKTEINESLEVSSNQQDFTFVIEGFKEKLGSFELTKRVENNFHYSIDYKYTVISEMLNGKLTCQSNDALKGVLYASPYKINSQCMGDAQGAVSLFKELNLNDYNKDTYDAYNNLKISYESSDGNDSQTDSLYSNELFEGSISMPILDIKYQKPSQQNIQKVALNGSESYLTNMVIAKDYSKGYFYGYDLDKEQIHISEIDLDSLEIKNLTYITNKIYNFEISKDGLFLYLVLREGCCNLPSIFEFDIQNKTLIEFASFENIVDSSDSNTTEYNSIRSLTSTKEGNILFILQDEGRFANENKLVEVSKNGVAEYISLGSDYVTFAIEDDALFVNQKNNITLYDISGDKLELVLTKEFIRDPKATRSGHMQVKNSKIYTHDGYVLDWASGNILANIGLHEMYYVNKFDIALEISGYELYVYSTQNGEILSSPRVRQIVGLPDINAFGEWLIGSDYLLLKNLSSSSQGQYNLIKIPMNKLLE